MEFSSGENLGFSWYGNSAKDEAKNAYYEVKNFFENFIKNKEQTTLKSDGISSFYYGVSVAMNRFGGESYSVETLTNDKAVVTIDEDYPLERSVEADEGVLDKLQKIIDKYDMKGYEARYLPSFEVRDGELWSLAVKYADKTKNFRSYGENATPKNAGEAFGEVRELLKPYRDKLWEGSYTDKSSAYLLSIGKVENGELLAKLSLDGRYEIECRGVVENSRIDLFLEDLSHGEVQNFDKIDRKKPLFMLFRELSLKDNQELGVFVENYLYLDKIYGE